MPRRALHLLLVAGLAAAMMGAGASGAVAQDNGDDNGELCPGIGIPSDRISVGLYTFNNAVDFGDTDARENLFSELSSYGYQLVEPYGQPYPQPANEFRDEMAAYGIRAASSHSGTAIEDGELNEDAYADIAAYANELGQDYISAGFPPGGFGGTATLDGTLQMAEWLDAQGQIAVDAGIEGGVLVHNHNPEFENMHEDPSDGEEKSAWEILVNHTDPDLVGFQLDTYWAEFAGFDSVELIEEYGDRIKMLHVKDGTVDSDDPEITQLGDGDLDFPGIFEAAWDHVDYYAYEYDNAPDAFDRADEAFEFMSCTEFPGRDVIDGPGNAEELCPDEGIPSDRISIQTFTLAGEIGFGEPDAAALENIYANLAAAGYRTVEPFGQPYGLPADEFRDLLAGFDIRAVSSHGNNAVTDGDLDEDAYAEVAAYANELGQDYISSGGPPGDFGTYEGALEMADLLNQQGQIAVDAGIEGGVLVHNHDEEWSTQYEVDGETMAVWEILAANTDPDLVGFQLDTYWTEYGGYDAIEVIEEYGDRIPMLHIKDGTTESDDPSITQLGEGDLDLAGIVEASWDDVDYYAFEYDVAPDAFNTAAEAFEFLSCMELDLDTVIDGPGNADELCPDEGIPSDRISIQTFTLAGEIGFGEPSVDDLENIYDNLAAAGYRTVEPFGQPYELSSADFRDLLADRGIRAVSSHSDNAVDGSDLDERVYADIAAYADELGQDYISSGRPPGNFDTYEGALEMADLLNQQGQIAVDAGIEGGVLVHNHNQEWEAQFEVDGETMAVWEILAANTDPDLVNFELDTYWTEVGGYDAIEVIEEYGDRIPMLHIKDGTADSDDPEITQLGEGDLDLAGIVEASWDDVDYYAYEYDVAPDAYNTAAEAFEFLSCMELDLPDEPGEVPDICEELGAPQIFTDVGNTPHDDDIACLAGLGIVRGMGDGTFNPRGDVTRGQLASFVARTMELQSGETLPIEGERLPDVGGPNSAHGDAISKLVTAGIVQGYKDGYFRPGDSVSRDQAAKYVAGALEYLTGEPLPTSGVEFDDVAPGSRYAADIDRLVTAGILDGYPDGTFQPREPIKRDQMSKLIANALQVAVEIHGEAAAG